MLKKELERHLLYRTETFAARRAGGAVQSISAEADNTALMRFFGWMAATLRPLVGDSLEFMLRPDIGDTAQHQRAGDPQVRSARPEAQRGAPGLR